MSVYSDKNQKVFVTSMRKVSLDMMKNWDSNRKCDITRVNEIFTYYTEEKVTLVPGIISAYICKNGKYNIYDGYHRYCAAVKYVTDTKKDIHIIFKILATDDQSIVWKEFSILNKHVYVPDAYMSKEFDTDKRNRACEVVDAICKKYTPLCSPARKPHAFNFNRDQLIDTLYSIDETKVRLDVEIIARKLLVINAITKTIVTSSKIPKRCTDTDFYVFWNSLEKIKYLLENDMQKTEAQVFLLKR